MMLHSFPGPIVAALLLGASVSQAGSLWTKETNNERGMFADKRAKNVGDILTIVVQESTTATQSQEITTFKDSKGGVESLVTNLTNQFIAGIPQAITAATGVKPPEYAPKVPPLDISGKNEYRGGGEITNRQTITNRTAVTVVDVLPNGNLVIEGAKVIRAGKETQFAYLRGIVRAADVQKDNTCLSTNIADAHVQFVPEGSLTEAQKKGWLLRLHDRLNPF